MSNVNYAYAVDLSNNNAALGTPGNGFDAKAYKAAGHRRIILKASQGIAYADTCFRAWVEDAAEAGLWVSAYHFADDTGSAADQADFFTDTLRDLPIHHRVIDLEQGSNIADPVAFRQEFGRAADLPYSDTGYLEQYGAGLALDGEQVWAAAYPNLAAGWWSHRVWGHQYSQGARVAGIVNLCDISVLL
jgi:GH25 family lysozyme M1 (1,4-beta-N-acetylmuramidase)